VRNSAKPGCTISIVHAPAAAVADAIVQAVDAFVDGAAQFDDITLLIVRRLDRAAA
jgi:serine phosphatase RsbU (regulator of sigma subunit)